MTRKHRRQYELLVRVSEFAVAYAHVFSESGAGRAALAAIRAAVEELAATDMVKLEASISARADRLSAARKTLTDLLLKVSQLARVLRATGRAVPPFELPLSRSDQSLLTAARQFARDAAGLEAEFAGHGMGSEVITKVATAFDAAVRDRGTKRADHVAANARIHDLLTAALRDVRRLDLIVLNELGADNVLTARWKQTRRAAKASRGSQTTESPETLEAAEPPEAVEAPETQPAAGAVTSAGPPPLPVM